MLQKIIIALVILSLTACSSWVFRRDIPQGNYLEQRLIDKLQVDMTKEQVKFILGTPILMGAYDGNTWHYIYRFKSGRDENFNLEKQFTVKFKDNKLITANGDFPLPESFHTPMVH